MALRRFALRAAGGFRGRDGKGIFAQGLLDCFGAQGGESGGPVFKHSFSVVDVGKRATRTVAVYWPARRVVVDVVDRDMLLDVAWSELLRACLQMEAAPQYVVLTNQRDVRLYDLAKERSEPRLTIALDELPKYSEAFSFFEADWSPGVTPRIINVDKVSKEVADLVAKAYRALVAKNSDRKDDVIRFTLQCIVAMFAEDIGLLPKEYFTTLLYRAGEEGGAEAKISELFAAMSTPVEAREDAGDGTIPFFNGGLFRDAISLSLDKAVLRALTKAAESNWTHVDPHIFGSVFQGVMDDAERHASGAHYTAREDIMSVVGPTIVEPLRARIQVAKKLEELKEILRDLSRYRVLDPACGSGNFLYIAFRELYRLETEVLVRIYDEFPSATQGKGRVTWASGIRATNFFGIDTNPFAVELAKTTLNMAKKIAFEQRKAEVVAKFDQFALESDPSLPLDNLDGNIVCGDALFSDWPAADAIVGNPPFLGEKRIRRELRADYGKRLQERFAGAGGDLCVYWFRKAHQCLGQDGRAGLIGTSAIRFGPSREAGLDYITANGGTITDAVSCREWPGDSSVNVSIVNWRKGNWTRGGRLHLDGKVYRVDRVPAHLQLHADIGDAKDLRYPPASASMGVIFGSDEFLIPTTALERFVAEGCVRTLASGADVLSGKVHRSPRLALWLADFRSEEAATGGCPAAFSYLQARVFPALSQRAAGKKATGDWKAWLKRWWQPQKPRDAFRKATASKARLIACAKVQHRPIFFMLSTRVVANPTLWLFGYDDDYSFGISQSSLHWAWVQAKGSRLKTDFTYTSSVWKTFPWPQEPTLDDVVAVGQAAQQLRVTRDRLMQANGWSLRDLYRSAEVEGPHPLKEAQAALDAAVEAAYGKPADQEATEFLLEMNLALAEDEAAGETIQGPGLPKVDGQDLDPKDPRWFSTDCIEPPPLPGAEEAASEDQAAGE